MFCFVFFFSNYFPFLEFLFPILVNFLFPENVSLLFWLYCVCLMELLSHAPPHYVLLYGSSSFIVPLPSPAGWFLPRYLVHTLSICKSMSEVKDSKCSPFISACLATIDSMCLSNPETGYVVLLP